MKGNRKGSRGRVLLVGATMRKNDVGTQMERMLTHKIGEGKDGHWNYKQRKRGLTRRTAG